MSICVYGEIGIDWLISSDCFIQSRIGGAGLYASLAAAKQEEEVYFLTVYGPEIPKEFKELWELLGVSFELATMKKDYSLPKYIVTGFKDKEKKICRPITDIKLGLNYHPKLPETCDCLLVFPLDHGLPLKLCMDAKSRGIKVLLDPKPNEKSIADALELMPYTSVLLVNEDEAKLLAEENELIRALNKIVWGGPELVVLKRGHNGCLLACRDGSIESIPAFDSKVVCSLGSGDVFGGTLAATYLRTKDIKYSTRLACCVAACFIEQLETEGILNRKKAEEELLIRKPLYHDFPLFFNVNLNQ